MSDQLKQTGHCLCGKVVVQVGREAKDLGVCHCKMCRRWTSGPWMAVLAGDDFIVKGKEFLTQYQSSKWAERAFCGVCGSALYYRLIPRNEIRVSAGLFEKKNSFKMERQLFIDKKPEFYEFSTPSNRLTSRYLIAGFLLGEMKNFVRRMIKRDD